MNKKPELQIFLSDTTSPLELPYADGGIRAGIPTYAQEYISETIDLNSEIVRHPSSTFYGKVIGHSMADEGIMPGDILVVDRSLMPEQGDLVVCSINGEFTVKRIRIDNGEVWLIASRKDFEPIKVPAGNRFIVWGVVTHTIRENRRRR